MTQSEPHLRDFLMRAGAGTTPHSGRALWDHLHGVHRILKAAHAPPYLCHAGLFHSVYGTTAFTHRTIARHRREEVQSLIGGRAEQVAWLFSILPRPRLLELDLHEQALDWESHGVDANTRAEYRRDLLGLECANLIEQRRIHEFPFLAAHAQEIGMLDEEGFFV